MKILIAGASGATGQRLAAELLKKEQQILAVVRSINSLPEELLKNKNMTVIEASLLDLKDAELKELIGNCKAIVSCLGHNMSFKGVFGKPRRLVTDATRRLCDAIYANQPQTPVKFILMNTVGNRNHDLEEQVSAGEKLVVGLLRLVLPPQSDNELAPEYLRTEIGHNDPYIEWVAVRPDTLLNEDTVTDYSLHASPTQSAIFGQGQTSRINVGHFMAKLITEDDTWNKWKGQMPVIYNKKAA